jgi:hypothetical protein
VDDHSPERARFLFAGLGAATKPGAEIPSQVCSRLDDLPSFYFPSDATLKGYLATLRAVNCKRRREALKSAAGRFALLL